MSAKQTRRPTAIKGRDASIFPTVSGLPWWAVIVVGVAGTAAALFVDGSSPLGKLFYVISALGFIAAALLAQARALFTAAVQIPIILFCAIPFAFYLRSDSAGGLKSQLIDMALPLASAFPFMLGITIAVTLICALRWWFNRSTYTGARDRQPPKPQATTARASRPAAPVAQPARAAAATAATAIKPPAGGVGQGAPVAPTPSPAVSTSAAIPAPGSDRRPATPIPAPRANPAASPSPADTPAAAPLTGASDRVFHGGWSRPRRQK